MKVLATSFKAGSDILFVDPEFAVLAWNQARAHMLFNFLAVLVEYAFQFFQVGSADSEHVLDGLVLNKTAALDPVDNNWERDAPLLRIDSGYLRKLDGHFYHPSRKMVIVA